MSMLTGLCWPQWLNAPVVVRRQGYGVTIHFGARVWCCVLSCKIADYESERRRFAFVCASVVLTEIRTSLLVGRSKFAIIDNCQVSEH